MRNFLTGFLNEGESLRLFLVGAFAFVIFLVYYLDFSRLDLETLAGVAAMVVVFNHFEFNCNNQIINPASGKT